MKTRQRPGWWRSTAQTWRTSGTAKMSGDAMDDLLEAKAAHIETGGDEDSTALSWDSLKGDSDQVFSLAMDLLLHPQFNAEKLQLAQQQEATGIVRRNDDEGEIASRESAKLVYGADSPYTRQPELATIGAVTLDDLKAWHDRTIGGKLIVGVSGDFDPAAMEAKLRAAFEGLPPAKAMPARHDKFQRSQARRLLHQQGRREPVEYADRRPGHGPAQSRRSLAGGDERYPRRRIRQPAVSRRSAPKKDWPMRWAAATASPRIIRHLPGGGADQERLDRGSDQAGAGGDRGAHDAALYREELTRAKDNILNSFLFRYDTREKVLAERVRLEFYGYPADYLETYKAALEKVTVADLDRVAKKYIHPDKLAVLVVGNGSEIKPPLDDLKLGPVQTVDITIPMPKEAGGGSPR